MKKLIGLLLIFYSLNSFSNVNLRSKYAGVWSLDCTNSNELRIYRVANLIGDDESTTKHTEYGVLNKSKYKFHAITEKKFKIIATNSNYRSDKLISTSNSEAIFEFVEDFKGINYNKTRLIDSIVTLENKDKIQTAKNGIAFSKQKDGSMKENGATPTLERCLN